MGSLESISLINHKYVRVHGQMKIAFERCKSPNDLFAFCEQKREKIPSRNDSNLNTISTNASIQLKDFAVRTIDDRSTNVSHFLQVLFRSGVLNQLEAKRDELLSDRIIQLQAFCRGYLARRRVGQRRVQVRKWITNQTFVIKQRQAWNF